MQTDLLTSLLKSDLDPNSIQERQQSGRTLSYIESWYVIDQLNTIFGYGNWERSVTVEKARCEMENGKSRVTYISHCELTVIINDNRVTRSGHGAGHGNGMADIGLAIESAIKEAESDSLKRAAMTFGNQFGLCLYDKSQAGVLNKDKQSRFLEYVQKFDEKTINDALSRLGYCSVRHVASKDYTNFVEAVAQIEGA